MVVVAEAHRGTGVARCLMAEAMRFYDRLGVAPAGKVFYRLTGGALATAACGHWPNEGNAP